MLVDPRFAEHLGQKAHAENLTVTSLDDGITGVLTMPTPELTTPGLEKAGRILGLLGPHMTVTWTLTWEIPAEDGSRTGHLTVSLTGIPASLTGPIHLSPTDTGSQLDCDLDFTVAVPLFGRTAEKLASAHVDSLASGAESIGQEWIDDNL